MDAIKIIEKLGKMAQKEGPPQVDISKAVMLEIAFLEQENAGFVPFEWFAGISAVAASIVAFLSFYAWRYMADPFIQLFAPFQEILPW
jgi:hypothetical protein